MSDVCEQNHDIKLIDNQQGLIEYIDPFSCNQLTYSEIIHQLSVYMVPSDNPNEIDYIPLLEKFANLLNFTERQVLHLPANDIQEAITQSQKSITDS